MRKLIALALVAMALVALAAAPALAEGYNQQTSDAATLAKGYGATTGFYTRATGYFSGPHGGYTTTTNKCQDCHSTHYASGSYKLLRASSAASACDYCHGGGGGSSINIMMDNAYKADTDVTTSTTGVAVESTTNGPGTGHTLGFTGNAPTDINPAYANAEGLACFSCHSPHGNSARIMTTMANPGRAMGTGTAVIPSSTPGAIGNSDGTINSPGEWGIDAVYGNLKFAATKRDGSTGFTSKPIWPNGRFLLLKNPDSKDATDNLVANDVGQGATVGYNKYAIDWNEPLGPADTFYGGGQDNDNDKAYPFAPQYQGMQTGSSVVTTQGGFLALSEFCTDCHDGSAGASTQKAYVWNAPENDYTTAYSHDAQPRH